MTDKRDAFKRLSKPRVEKACKAIKLLCNLSRRSQYEYTNLEAVQIKQALENELEGVIKSFKIEDSGEHLDSQDPEIEQTNKEALSWASWARETIDRDPKEAKAMLDRAILAHRSKA
jgi:hypothetical protein|tara:strand:- start:367 stop:717 length:351 start_codon:yes stop_codon:yes gene_type:complete